MKLLKRNISKIYVTVVILAIVVGVTVVVAQDMLAGYDGDMDVNRTTTIGDVTVTLESLKVESGMLEVVHSASTNPKEIHAYDYGLHSVVFANGDEIELDANKADADGRTQTSYFVIGGRDLGIDDVVTINLGSYLVPREDIFGSTRIDLPQDFYKAFKEGHEVMRLDADLFADYHHNVISDESLHYRITRLTLKEARNPYVSSLMTITLEPANEWARQVPLAAVGEDRVILKDDVGGEYGRGGTSVRWGESEEVEGYSVRKISEVVLMFSALPSPNASYFKLQVEGAAESIGPFVFEDLQVPPDANVESSTP